MELSLGQKYNRKIANAIAEFELIDDGDRILVAFSGGIDSSFLLYSLKILGKSMSIDFKITALTIDIGFDQIDYSLAKKFCKELNIEYYIKDTKIADIIKEKDDSNPCSNCSYFRKGAITEFIKEKNYKFDKIAYGHHLDDVVETFLMSIIYSGQIKTFLPKNPLNEAKANVIRPLINLREDEINEFMNNLNYKPISNKCPYSSSTKRREMKEFINSFDDRKQILYNLAAAVREDSVIDLWPEEKDNDFIQKKVYDLWES
ncbi:MAG: tRNA 2-thiocytidine biosynthesis TtcA family protein [Bacillota bacterium]